MAITSAADPAGVRVTTAAKNGTLGSQAAASTTQIIFPSTIATNNGNLMLTPTFVGRKVIVRQGLATEETRYMTAIDGTGLIATVNEAWTVQPATNDTYHVSYRNADADTLTGVALNAKTGLFEYTRRFSVGTAGGGAFAYFAVTDYEGMEMNDAGASLNFVIEPNGRFDSGYLQGGAPVAGGVITCVNNGNGEPFMLFQSGSIAKLNASIVWSQRNDTVLTTGNTSSNNLEFNNCTFIKTAYSSIWEQSTWENIIWQGFGLSGSDYIRIQSGTNVDTITMASTAGWRSQNDNLAETLTVRNCTFIGNSPNVVIYGKKSWNFVNPLLWVVTSSLIEFTTNDSNTGSLLYSLDITTAEQDGTLLSGSRSYVYEGLINQDLPSTNRIGTDANGFATCDVLKQRYTNPGTFTTQSFGDHAVKVYKYGYSPFVTSITFNEPITLGVTLLTDTALGELTASAAITSGSGIVVERHGTGETDTRPMKVLHYDTGIGSVPQSGEKIYGLTSLASGTLVEYIGTAVDGTLVIERWNGIEFTNNENMSSSISTFFASADTTGGAQSFYEEYTWEVSCSNKDLTDVYDYAYAKIAEAAPDNIWLDVIIWGEEEQSNLIYYDGVGYYTERNVNLTEGVWLSHVGAGTISYLTSDDGTQYFPPEQFTFTISGLVTGTEVRIYNATTNEEIDGIESSGTSFSYVYVYSGDIPIYVVVFNLTYRDIRLTDLTLSNANQTIPVQQQFDRNYLNP